MCLRYVWASFPNPFLRLYSRKSIGARPFVKIRFTLYRLSGGGFTTACSVFGVIALNFIMCVMLRDQRLGLRVRFGATKSQHVKP